MFDLHDLTPMRRLLTSNSPGPRAGFFSYELGMSLHRGVAGQPIGCLTRDKSGSGLPSGLMRTYGLELRWDPPAERLTALWWDSSELIEIVDEIIGSGLEPRPVCREDLPRSRGIWSLDEADYEARVEECLELIGSGIVYQITLSTCYAVPFPLDQGLALFLRLFSRYPARFFAYLNLGDHKIISTSPERFLRLEGSRISSEPIKGTVRLYDASPEALEVATRQLLESPKEGAELAMIVDLIRNDISSCCVPGSVQVPLHKGLFQVDDLVHMYSEVTGLLEPGLDGLDLLVSCFPGGSVTGCPKGAAMQYMELLEPHRREIYCGTVFIFDSPSDMDSSITIRTASLDREVLRFYAGSGIVADSLPQSEGRETRAKAGKFLRELVKC